MSARTANKYDLENQAFTKPLFELWDTLNDHGPHAIDEALHYCMTQLSTWLMADHASWHGTLKGSGNELSLHDSMYDWRIAASVYLPNIKDSEPTQQCTNNKKRIRDAHDDAGILNQVVTSEAGHFRAYRLNTELISSKPFVKDAQCVSVFRDAGLIDRIWVVFPITAHSESYFVFDRKSANETFSIQELIIASQALRAIKWFHQSLFLSYGLGRMNTPLTQKERIILHDLLVGLSERAIARKNHLTEGTVHQYCTRIYKKYGTRGRIELMSLWI